MSPLMVSPAILLLLALSDAGAGVSKTVESSRPSFAVVELFTSEGCSSCPPADRLLADLVTRARREEPRIFPLAFHVDYWDRLGWRDPFGDPAHARRQSQYAGAFESRYTPQMVVNGRESFVGSDGARARRAIDEVLAQPAAIGVRLQVESVAADSVHIEWEVTTAPRGTDLHGALVERGLTSAVQRGENRGRILQHDNVVRAFRTVALAQATAGELALALPAAVRPENASIIVYLQSSRDHAILGAASVDLPVTAR